MSVVLRAIALGGAIMAASFLAALNCPPGSAPQAVAASLFAIGGAIAIVPITYESFSRRRFRCRWS